MELERGASAPERRGDGPVRRILTADHPLAKSALAGLDLSAPEIASVRGFANRLSREAERWRLRGGLGERGRISKADASRMWPRLFPATSLLLAAYRPGGGK